MNGLSTPAHRPRSAHRGPATPTPAPQAPMEAAGRADAAPTGTLALAESSPERPRYKRPSDPSGAHRRSNGVADGRAPNGQSWSELFMEADPWEGPATFSGRSAPPPREPADTQPRPWPALPPPDARRGVPMPWVIGGATLLCILGLWLAA